MLLTLASVGWCFELEWTVCEWWGPPGSERGCAVASESSCGVVGLLRMRRGHSGRSRRTDSHSGAFASE